MLKVAGVEAVKVSLNDGLTILDLKPGNTITLAKIRLVIKNNGFVSKEGTVVARGTPSSAGPELHFTVSGTNEELAVSSAPRRIGDDWQLAIRCGGSRC